MDENDQAATGLERDPVGYSAMLASSELHYGRIEWLAEHIRLSNFNIRPVVAQKLLALIEGGQKNLIYEIKIVRRSDLPPRHEDPQLLHSRNYEMACEVARLGGFERGKLAMACHTVGTRHGLRQATVMRLIAPYKSTAIENNKEHDIHQAYERGEIDFWGSQKFHKQALPRKKMMRH